MNDKKTVEMMNQCQYCFFKLIIVFVILVPLEAVTVNPCPTNKIAPHNRVARWDQNRPRTFGSFYSLFTPSEFQDEGLVETPQEDTPDDCGDIEDYDENDLSSVTPQSQRRHEQNNHRFFFGGPFNYLLPFHQPVYQVTKKPPVTFRPLLPSYPPTRPPYSSGGVFGNNIYRPPISQDPSDDVKPVHDGTQESSMTYRPGLVGAPIGHIVGASQITPTRRPSSEKAPLKKLSYENMAHFPPRTTQATASTSKRPRPKKINKDDSIIGSFIGLLFE